MIVHVNVVTDDAVLARRLSVYARRIDTLEITPTDTPQPEERTDSYVAPLDWLPWLLDGASRPPTWLPVIAYGGAAGLRSAFLAGCRDYLREPWSLDELALRIQRLVDPSGVCLPWGRVELVPGKVISGHGEVELSIQEYRILQALLAQLGRPVPRALLFYALWGRTDVRSRAVDVHISALRRKLKAIAGPSPPAEPIRCAARCGYYIEAPPSASTSGMGERFGVRRGRSG